jgi:hypothetical protein
MNLKNLDWTHIAYVTISILLTLYSTLVADGVPLPAQLAVVAMLLTSIAGLLKQSPIATKEQIQGRSTIADKRSLQINREDQTK